MPSYKDLLKLLREGKTPEEIVRRMNMRPSHWRRMLSGKRMRDALKMEEDISVLMAVHRIAAAVEGAADKFTELMDTDSPETARKVCLALLHEGLRTARKTKAQTLQAAKRGSEG
jgi:hypothetical protein